MALAAAARGPTDAPLAPFRLELLDLALQAASALPIDPHVKTRSRAQETVATACFELGLPQRALRCIEAIANWRRAAGYADYAHYCAVHGHTDGIQRYLDLAAQGAEDNARDANAQEWRTDQIKAKIARTHLVLGQADLAAKFTGGLEDSQAGVVQVAQAGLTAADHFDQHLQSVDGILATGSFDAMRNALQVCAELYDRCYDDPARRAALTERVLEAGTKLPATVRIEFLMTLAGHALTHADPEEALARVQDAQALLDQTRLRAEHHLPLAARLASLRGRAGDTEPARKQIDALRERYAAEQSSILDIERAGVLRPIAEALQQIGAKDAALAVYTIAVQEGMVNPNSRPRAEDLVATCVSMARCGFQPDADLRTRLIQIGDGLSQPW